MEKMLVTKPELRYTQCLWYAWGRIDSGAHNGDGFTTDDAFMFAERQRVAQEQYDSQARHMLPSIIGAWENYVERERAHGVALAEHPSDCAFCASGEGMRHNYEPTA